ncbi:methyltransferase domain-containing protein [Candidatus Gottesmanbacteria bacterium]|nr:methyltransferase domain-containing protein [Candidatus Gottesmanbacteria bacterium]
MAEEVWEAGIKFLLQRRAEVARAPRVLILGLGGGSLVKLLNKQSFSSNQYFPKAKITGVEIDPLMIELGKKYLEMEKIKNLKIVIGDAEKFIEKIATRDGEFFDLIFVDVYCGDQVPKNCETEFFLQNLKKILTQNGMIVFNRLYFKNHIFEAKNFLDKLKKIFNDLANKKVLTNLLIFAKNSSGSPPSLKLRRA